MAEVIKTKYMDKATRGYSEYVARDLNALQTISPKEGDRAILLDGSLYICVDNGQWDIAGGAKETDIFIITVGYNTGVNRGYTIDKTYAEIYSAAQVGKTLIMVDPVALSANGLPIILTPYSFNSDGSGTFVTIAIGDDMGGSKDYRYSITVYPDNTVIPRWEDLSQELDHTVTFKVDGNPYTIVSVKDGQSVSAPIPNPTSESGTFAGWLNGETSITFPLTPTEDLWLNAEFKTTRTEMEWKTANDEWWYASGMALKSIKKTNADMCISGWCIDTSSANGYSHMLVGLTESAVETTPNSADYLEKGQHIYDGRTYYYALYTVLYPRAINRLSPYCIQLANDVTNHTDALNQLLDHYYLKD